MGAAIGLGQGRLLWGGEAMHDRAGVHVRVGQEGLREGTPHVVGDGHHAWLAFHSVDGDARR